MNHPALAPQGRALAERLGTVLDFSPRADGRDGSPKLVGTESGAAVPIFTGADQARMAHVAVVGLPELVDRFECELELLLCKVDRIDRPKLRLVTTLQVVR